MYCHNCGRTDRVVLIVEFVLRRRPPPGRDPPAPGLTLQCEACQSTDVAGDPAALFGYASE